MKQLEGVLQATESVVRYITPGMHQVQGQEFQKLTKIKSKIGLISSIYVRCHVVGLGGISEKQETIETSH